MAPQKANRRAGDAAARESDRFGRLIAPSKNPRASGPHPRACAEAALEQIERSLVERSLYAAAEANGYIGNDGA
jgi:hypothetical protein